MAVTRILGSTGAPVLAVARAKLKGVRGPAKGAQLELSSLGPVVLGSDEECDLVLKDDTVSARHATLAPGEHGWRLRDLGSTNGVLVDGVRVIEALLDGPRRIKLGESELAFSLAGDQVEHALGAPFGGLVGESPAMRALFALAAQAAPADSTVLIEGESGSGKEMLAHALHAASPRRDGPFVVVDCGALAAGVVESELYGHEKGAFTGADRARAGALAEASSGTVFLDEIGELPLEQQVKLLRALEAREVRPLGGRPRPIDVRVIAATHRPLPKLVAAGRFRDDLYYRLAVIKLRLPPLRERREDVLPLARRFVGELSPGMDPARLLSPAVASALEAHAWPGNVRELRNVIERLLRAGELATELRAPAQLPDWETARRNALDAFEREYLKRLLAESGGNVSKAAARAGLSRQMLHRMLKKHELRGDDG
jgi:DNA-binding NtrC family response regulator